MKLKYLKIVAITTFVAITACSEQQDFNQADVINAAVEIADQPIRFSSYLNQMGTTRTISDAVAGGVTGGIDGKQSLAQHRGFGVFGYHSSSTFTDGAAVSVAPNFMYNQEVAGTDAASPVWSYSPIKYWPNGTDAANASGSPSNTATEATTQYLNFYAYAPYVASAGSETGIIGMPNNSTTNLIFTYKLPATPTAASSVDFLWGVRGTTTYLETDGDNNTSGSTYNVNLTKQIVSETVDFSFKHALAKIGAIKVVADLDGNSTAPTTSGFGGEVDAKTLITLTSVDIKDNGKTVNASGTFDISQGTWTTTTKVASAGDQVAAEITNATANVNSYIWEPTSGTPIVNYTASETNKWTKPEAPTTGVLYSGVVPTELRDLYSTGNFSPIMFIPGSGQQLKIAVTYIVRTYDSKLDATTASGGEGTWSKVTQTITNTVTLPDMQPNHSYTIVMHIGLTSVKFSAEVSEWEGGDTKEIWLPSNVVEYYISHSIGASENISALNLSSYFTADKLGDYVTYTTDGNVSTVNASDISSVSITMIANTGTTKQESHVTFVGKNGKLKLTITQDAGALTVSGTGSNTGVAPFTVSDAGSNSKTVTKAMISIKDESDADVAFTTDDDDNVTSITFGTVLTSGKSYTITVKIDDATGTKTVAYTAP